MRPRKTSGLVSIQGHEIFVDALQPFLFRRSFLACNRGSPLAGRLNLVFGLLYRPQGRQVDLEQASARSG
jgi:hypothetical protein